MIRVIQPSDWPGIDLIQRGSFPPSAIEAVESLRSIAVVAPEMCVVVEKHGELLGYLLAHPWMPEDLPPLNRPLASCPAGASCVFIHDLALLPSARGKGLANEMVHGLLATAGKAGMASASLLSVQGTLGFWKRFGFVERPELTKRFQTRAFGFYEIDFQFMTAPLG